MKAERLEARVDPETKQIIQLAASLQNISDTEFMVKTLVAASEKVINKSNVTYLTEKQFERLEAYLESGYIENKKLIALAKQPRKYVTGEL